MVSPPVVMWIERILLSNFWIIFFLQIACGRWPVLGPAFCCLVKKNHFFFNSEINLGDKTKYFSFQHTKISLFNAKKGLYSTRKMYKNDLGGLSGWPTYQDLSALPETSSFSSTYSGIIHLFYLNVFRNLRHFYLHIFPHLWVDNLSI